MEFGDGSTSSPLPLNVSIVFINIRADQVVEENREHNLGCNRRQRVWSYDVGSNVLTRGRSITGIFLRHMEKL